MKRLLFCLCICAFIAMGAWMEARSQQLRIYSDQYRESICASDVQAGQMVDIWLWAEPGSEGLRCVELSTVVEDDYNFMLFVPEYNPDILPSITGSFPGDDLSACFGSCYTDWVWVVKSTLYCLSSPECMTIDIQPLTGQPYPKTLDCNYVEENAYVGGMYSINCPSWDCTCVPPEISRIDVMDVTDFVMVLDCETGVTTMTSIDNYSLFEKDNPENVIPIIDITCVDWTYEFSLGEPLTPYTTYTLHADYIDGLYVDDRDGADFDFACSPVATLLQEFDAVSKDGMVELSWSMSSVDDAVAFSVSRSASGGVWAELPAEAIEREGLSFTYLDDGVEPDESYVYRVEYETAGSRTLLFQTEAVATPSMPLSLEQNAPNPFNPVTEIRYYLPEAADVRLEVYDISGRLVRTLAGGLQPKGWQTARWDGSDGAGRSVASGVYFYRLRAGREIVSKKMILLR